ncbi:uncharacterized protein PpBr36_10494 [Pyricularia pennisetigena]|uniref:uncharacterized protein n=1 Tax=Pyricularia pennisetigena TaxID=1578925 RepID=UPI00114EBFD6|nr:uncharacterized protein PpBr36_10494 [Pyricularia pennisetigena]TLS21089.1 hypothetical protein PpBr36_10494 [Pyricularia pennisetigena]
MAAPMPSSESAVAAESLPLQARSETGGLTRRGRKDKGKAPMVQQEPLESSRPPRQGPQEWPREPVTIKYNDDHYPSNLAYSAPAPNWYHSTYPQQHEYGKTTYSNHMQGEGIQGKHSLEAYGEGY